MYYSTNYICWFCWFFYFCVFRCFMVLFVQCWFTYGCESIVYQYACGWDVARAGQFFKENNGAQFNYTARMCTSCFAMCLFNLLFQVSILKRKRASAITYMESTVDWHFYSSSLFQTCFHCLCHVSPSISKNTQNNSFF